MRVFLSILVTLVLTVIKRSRMYERADYLERRTNEVDMY